MTDETRVRRTTKKPAWLLDNVDPATAEVEGEPKPRAQPKRITNTDPVHKHPAAAHKQHTAEKQHRTDMPRRMCLNPACKCPFESPQWRRGPLGPGTLCNACGTRYARIEAKKRGEKKGGSRLRPQDLAEWQAFEEQLQHPPDMQQVWRAHTSRLVNQLQELQQQEELGGATSNCGDAAEQQYSYDDEYEDIDDEQQQAAQGQSSSYVDGLLQRRLARLDNPPDSHTQRCGSAAAAPIAAPGPEYSQQQHAADDKHPAAGTSSPCLDNQQQQQSSHHESHGRMKRRQRRFDEDASDSQEAAACSYPEQDKGLTTAAVGGDGGLGTAGDHFLHLLAVGEAMIKTEGVAPEDRQKAWEEYVEKRLPTEQHSQQPAHSADTNAPKRYRFKSEADERQRGRSEQLPVPPKDRFERLLAEAEQCIRARSASPLLRPITPQFGNSADGSRPQQAGSAPAATLGDAAATTVSSAAEKSPLPRTSRLGDAGRQSGAQALFPPHLELPAAATTITTVTGSRLCAGGPLDASAAAARHCNVAGSRLEDIQQRHAQAQVECLIPDHRMQSPFESAAALAEPWQMEQQHQCQVNTTVQHQAGKQAQQRLQQDRQQQLQRLACLREQQQQQHNPQAALLSQLCNAGALQSALQRLLRDPELCAMLSRCLSDPVATELLRGLLKASSSWLQRHRSQELHHHNQPTRPDLGISEPPQRPTKVQQDATAPDTVPAQLPAVLPQTMGRPSGLMTQAAVMGPPHDLAPSGPTSRNSDEAIAPVSLNSNADDTAGCTSCSPTISDGEAGLQPEVSVMLHEIVSQQAKPEAATDMQQWADTDAVHVVATCEATVNEQSRASNRVTGPAAVSGPSCQPSAAKRKRSGGWSSSLPPLAGASSAVALPAAVSSGAGQTFLI